MKTITLRPGQSNSDQYATDTYTLSDAPLLAIVVLAVDNDKIGSNSELGAPVVEPGAGLFRRFASTNCEMRPWFT